jgi:hypothetical protein
MGARDLIVGLTLRLEDTHAAFPTPAHAPRIGFVTGQGLAGGRRDLAVAKHVQHRRAESVRS